MTRLRIPASRARAFTMPQAPTRESGSPRALSSTRSLVLPRSSSGPDLVKVDGNRSDHLPTDRDQPLLGTFTQNANQALVEPEVVQRKTAQLGDPQPGAIPELQEGAVPPRQRLLNASGGKDGLHVRHSEGIGKFPSSLRSLEPVGGIDRHKPFADEEAEVGPHGRNLAPNRSRAEAEVFQGENEIAQQRPGRFPMDR